VENLGTKDLVRGIFDELSPDAKLVLAEVIKIEHSNLHLGHPHGLPGEIQAAIDRVIR